MSAARSGLSLVGLVLLGAGILFQFFIILSGYITGYTPFNRTYALQQGSNRWTYLALCQADGDYNGNCGPTQAAFPFVPSSQISNAPANFSDDYNKYFYLSRFGSVFQLISLFFAALSFGLSVLALCSRLGAYLTGSTLSLAVFFQALTAALTTAWIVIGRNAFQAAGQDATIGTYFMGWLWASFAAYFIAMVLFCTGGAVGGSNSSGKRSFGRKRSTRSRGSFIDNESGRHGIKDEYD